MTENERMWAGKLYNPLKAHNPARPGTLAAVKVFNESEYWRDEGPLRALLGHFRKVGDNVVLIPPFFCDHGDRITIGDHFFANTGLTILDEHEVSFGDHVYLAPHVSIYTAGHPIAAHVRCTDVEYARPVRIGDHVWIGGNTVINPGVTIGSNVVIGSGSVVTKDIPSGVVAAGNPCRVLRPITREEELLWQEQYHDYLRDCP